MWIDRLINNFKKCSFLHLWFCILLSYTLPNTLPYLRLDCHVYSMWNYFYPVG